ncbi:MAG: hypothetical protein ABJA69_02780 [Acidobacteriaceae bacterium]
MKILKATALLLLTFASQLLVGQGIHITKRGQSNPNPVYNSYSDVVGEGNYAYVSSWHNTAGIWIFDVSNPNSPKYAARYAPAGTSANMQAVEVLNGIGYFGDDAGGGIHIVDLSNPLVPKLITRITSAHGGYNKAHDLTLDGNGHMFVPNYRVNTDVQVWNVSTPSAPYLQMTLRGTDKSSVHDVTVKNNRLFMSGWGGTEDIWDVTNMDTQTPVLLGSFTAGVHTQDVSATDDGNFLICPREALSGGDVRVFDISNPANVFMVADLMEPNLGIAATSPSTTKIMGNLLFVAWYQAGLLVFNITDPTNPVMVGSYDTWSGPSNGGQGGGDGDWGVWPYLGVNTVLISDRTTGLYVLDCSQVSSQPAAYSLTFAPATLTGSFPSTGTVHLLGVSPAGGLTVQVSSGSPSVDPAATFIPAGTNVANYSETTHSVASKLSATLSLTVGSYSTTGALTLLPPAPSSVVVTPTPVRGGFAATGRVTLNAPAAVNVSVSLFVMSGGGAIASMPSSVTVPAGFTTANFTIKTKAITSTTQVKISAAANATSKSYIFSVLANIPSALTFSPASVTGGGVTTGTVTFPAPVSVSTAVSLAVLSGATAVNNIPLSVTVAAGSTHASFSVVTKAVGASTLVKVSATANGAARSSTFTVK